MTDRGKGVEGIIAGVREEGNSRGGRKQTRRHKEFVGLSDRLLGI